MRYFNPFYLVVFLAGVGLWWLHHSYRETVEYCYGFAENKETEINLNYPVVVDQIFVTPGQRVRAGEPLLDVYRIQPEEVLVDQPYRIAELRSKAEIWRAEQQHELDAARERKRRELATLDAEVQRLEAQRNFQRSLYADLATVDSQRVAYAPITDKIQTLRQRRTLLVGYFDRKIDAARRRLELGAQPYEDEVSRLEAEQRFDADNRYVSFQLTAPTDGLIGNLYCRRSEHIPSYKTLLSFYEPNPSAVKAYVQEDMDLQLAVGDSLEVRSVVNAAAHCRGVVSGLGSRIVEIPERMRRIPTLKTYGREILVRIPAANAFLQKEKVILSREDLENRRTAAVAPAENSFDALD